MSQSKYLNTKLAAMWAYREGSLYMSMPVDDMVFDALQNVEKGGKLVLKILKEESRRSEKSPYAYLEYISKDDVDAFQARSGSAGASASRKATKNRASDDSEGI